MSDFNQNQAGNYQNNQNYQMGQNPLNMPLYPSITHNNEDEYPSEELINSQNLPENNNLNYTPQKPEIQERVSDAVAPPAINPDMTNYQPVIQTSQEPIYQKQEVSPVIENMRVYAFEEERRQPPRRRCEMTPRKIIVLSIFGCLFVGCAIIIPIRCVYHI